MITNKKVDILLKEKHNLIRQFDRKEISEFEYNMKINTLKNQIKKQSEDKMEEVKIEENNNVNEPETEKVDVVETETEDVVETETETEKVDETETETEKVKKKSTPRSDSNSALILKALADTNVKNDSDAIEFVKNNKQSEFNEKGTKNQLNSIKKLCVNHKQKRYEKYRFDEEKYQLYEE